MGCNCGGAVQHIAHGVAGLAKATLGIGRADEDTIERRRAICRACPSAVPCVGNVVKFCTCRECGCVLKAKTANAGESCPLGKWTSLTISGSPPTRGA